MNTKTQVGIAIGIAAVSFAVGRYTVPSRLVVDNKQTSISQKVNDKVQDEIQDTRKQTKTVEIKKPNGEQQRITTVTEDTQVKHVSQTNNIDLDLKQAENKKDMAKSSSTLKVYAMAGMDLSRPNGLPVYGLGVSRNIIGPISLGAWGLNSGVLGLSIGLEF